MFKRITLMILICMVAFASYSYSGSFEVKLKSYCTKEWPGNFRMQKYCYDCQMEAISYFTERGYAKYFKSGIDKLNKNKQKDLTSEELIVLNCMREWSPPNYRMIVYCCDEEFKALEEMRKIK